MRNNYRSLTLKELSHGGFVVSGEATPLKGSIPRQLYASHEIDDALRFIREAWETADTNSGFRPVDG